MELLAFASPLNRVTDEKCCKANGVENRLPSVRSYWLNQALSKGIDKAPALRQPERANHDVPGVQTTSSRGVQMTTPGRRVHMFPVADVEPPSLGKRSAVAQYIDDKHGSIFAVVVAGQRYYLGPGDSIWLPAGT
jgi:hypothetical protein